MPRPVWFEIPADDPGAAIKFYQHLFDWRMTKFDDEIDYWLIDTSDQPGGMFGGAIFPRGQGACCRNCISVDSLAPYQERIHAAGGVMYDERMVIPHAILATASDSEGNDFRLFAPPEGETLQPPFRSNRPSALAVVHFEIPADDVGRALWFYDLVFGWEARRSAGPRDYWILSTGADADPGINGAIMERGDNPCTVNTITVPDVDQWAARIAAARGDVVLPRTAITGVGWFASCTDPEGNPFGILQLDETAQETERELAGMGAP